MCLFRDNLLDTSLKRNMSIAEITICKAGGQLTYVSLVLLSVSFLGHFYQYHNHIKSCLRYGKFVCAGNCNDNFKFDCCRLFLCIFFDLETQAIHLKSVQNNLCDDLLIERVSSLSMTNNQ